MEQLIAAVTLGVADIKQSRRFYVGGLGFEPVFENDEIVFFQMNGCVLGLFRKNALEVDMKRAAGPGPAACALAHNVRSREEVDLVIGRARAAGAVVLKEPTIPPWGGYSGYFADPDGHAWEVAWNPAWPIDENGLVRFGV